MFSIVLTQCLQRDFLVIHGEGVTEASLHDIADMHRKHDASMTMLFKVGHYPHVSASIV